RAISGSILSRETTSAPVARIAWTIASPMPRAPPVTTARRPLKLSGSMLSLPSPQPTRHSRESGNDERKLASLVHQPAAADIDGGTRDVAGVIGGEEQDRAGEIRRRRHIAHGNLGDLEIELLLA